MAPEVCSYCGNAIDDRESILLEDADRDLHATSLNDLHHRLPTGAAILWHSGCPTTYTPPPQRDLAIDA